MGETGIAVLEQQLTGWPKETVTDQVRMCNVASMCSHEPEGGGGGGGGTYVYVPILCGLITVYITTCMTAL